MALIAYKTLIKFPIFSLKETESFQISSSLPIPQPSSLIGALAYSYAIYKNVNSEEAIKLIRDKVILARARLPKEVMITPNPIMLWRFRILDRGYERPKKKGAKVLMEELIEYLSKREYDRAKELIEVRLKDALYREYVFTPIIETVWITKRELPLEIFYLINRIGDTESLCNVVKAEKIKCDAYSLKEIETLYPFVYDTGLIEKFTGDYYTIMKMNDEKGLLRNFVLPLGRGVRELRKGKRCIIFYPSRIHVEFKKSITVYRVNNEYLFLGD
mgnify:CR=1 FL=1